MLRAITICLAFLASIAGSTAQTWSTFSSSTRGMAFYYPPGWEVSATDRTASRFLENYMIQPAGQNFNGRPGEGIIRIFDPMFIMEESRARYGINTGELFARFVHSLPGEQNATISQRTYNGVNYLYAVSYSQGMETHYAGVNSASGFPNFAGMAIGPGGADRWLPILFQVTSSMSDAWAGSGRDGPAGAVRNWFGALRNGDARSLQALACSQASLGMVLMNFADPSIMNFMARAGTSYDFSNLRFLTVASGSTAAVVRVGGNLVEPNGAVVPAYQSAGMLGGSNVLIVRNEGGYWRVCGPARGGTR